VNNFIFLYRMHGPYKLECLSLAGLSNLLQCSTLPYWAHSQCTKKMKCCEYGPKDHIHSALFSFYLMHGPCKLECLSLAGQSNLLQFSTLPYWAHLYVAKKCCEYGLCLAIWPICLDRPISFPEYTSCYRLIKKGSHKPWLNLVNFYSDFGTIS
jgi:hypothetical protein